MALKGTIYRFRLDLSDVDRNCYQAFNLTLIQHPSETIERMVLRLLAFALSYREGLEFTKGVCEGDEPDLWCHALDGRVELWGEVGLPEAARLQHASRHAEQLFLLAAGAKFGRWQEHNLQPLEGISNLAGYRIDWTWLQKVAAGLERSAQWSLTVSDGVLYLNDGVRDWTTPLERLAGGIGREDIEQGF
jgi:uncharacterized protein YaeQ